MIQPPEKPLSNRSKHPACEHRGEEQRGEKQRVRGTSMLSADAKLNGLLGLDLAIISVFFLLW